MADKPRKVLRCAVYTRKSTEHGLELEFNSLDAQREACEAYIKSQASEGWQVLPRHYDDPAYSGGNLDRPAVRRLLKDIEAGLIDVVVVYKIDRLTRSLADFAKLVEAFDAKSVSFVAVTQQFNTTTSMGRLTLNVLLSFAQFERELASERVRDKIAASRKKGKWTGGSVPLGYDSKDKRLVVNPAEAKTVRFIFECYLALKSMQKLIEELDRKGIVTKRREIANRTVGNAPFTYGALAYLLKNRIYLGEIGHDGHWFAGEHEPIVERAIFEKVQHLMKANTVHRTAQRQQSAALLAGLLYDDHGNRMSPSYTVKNGVRYPCYVSSALLRGRKDKAGSMRRAPAREIESAVLMGIRAHKLDHGVAAELISRVGTEKLTSGAGTQKLDQRAVQGLTPRELIEQTVDRIVIEAERLLIEPKVQNGAGAPIEVPWSPKQRNGAVIEESGSARSQTPPDPKLVQAIVRAHAWLRLLSQERYGSIEELAQAVDLHPKVIRNTIRLAFLSPAVTKAAFNGDKPALGLSALIRSSSIMSWNQQQITCERPVE